MNSQRPGEAELAHPRRRVSGRAAFATNGLGLHCAPPPVVVVTGSSDGMGSGTDTAGDGAALADAFVRNGITKRSPAGLAGLPADADVAGTTSTRGWLSATSAARSAAASDAYASAVRFQTLDSASEHAATVSRPIAGTAGELPPVRQRDEATKEAQVYEPDHEPTHV